MVARKTSIRTVSSWGLGQVCRNISHGSSIGEADTGWAGVVQRARQQLF